MNVEETTTIVTRTLSAQTHLAPTSASALSDTLEMDQHAQVYNYL